MVAASLRRRAFSAVRRSGVSSGSASRSRMNSASAKGVVLASCAFSAAGPLLAQHLVGVLAALDDGELEAAAGLQQRQRPVHAARRPPGARRGRRRSRASARGGGARASPSALRSAPCPWRPPPAIAGRAGRRSRPCSPRPPPAAALVRGRRGDDLARLGQAVELVALVEERGLRAVQVLGAGLRIHRPAAERDHPPARVGDREDDPVAEAVVGRAAVLRRDQQAGLDQLGRPRALGDQIVLQRRAAGRREAQAEARPLLLRQAAPVPDRRAPRGPPGGAARPRTTGRPAPASRRGPGAPSPARRRADRRPAAARPPRRPAARPPR